MRKIIFCVLFAVLFHPALVLASDYGVGAYVDRTDDFRRQKDELRRMNEISEQVDQDRREADEVFRQRRYEDKVIKQTLKLEEQKARASQKAARDQLLVKAPSASGNTLFDIILAWIFRYGLYLLIPACCWFSYYYTVIFLRKKHLQDEENDYGNPQSNLLAVVNQWRFRQEDFKNYLDKFNIFLSSEIFELGSPEFKRYFVYDLAVTEILFQEALNRKMGEGKEFEASLSGYRAHLEGLLRDSQVFLNLQNNYKLSFKSFSGPGSGYVSYYRVFLDILMLVSQKSEEELLALYGRRLLIDKLISQIAPDPGALDKTQQELSKLIDKFKQVNKVLIPQFRYDISKVFGSHY